MRSKGRRQDKTIIIRVREDKGTHQTGRDTPRGSPDKLLLTILVREGYIKGLGEVLSEEV